MSHIPYGYRLENGVPMIDEDAAGCVRGIFEAYLRGENLVNAAKSAGRDMTHSSVKLILRNRRYLGEDGYPAIISQQVFDKAAEELTKRAKMLGRQYMSKKKEKHTIATSFYLISSEHRYDDPFEQATFIYSQIEEAKDGE